MKKIPQKTIRFAYPIKCRWVIHNQTARRQTQHIIFLVFACYPPPGRPLWGLPPWTWLDQVFQ